MSVDGAQDGTSGVRIPRGWPARDRLVLTSLRSPVMLLGWIFLVYVFGYLAYWVIAHRIDVAADPYATQEPHVFWVVLAILFSVLMVLLMVSLVLSFTVVDRDGVHAYRFLVCYWRRQDFSWEEFRWGAFVTKMRSVSPSGPTSVDGLYVSRKWKNGELKMRARRSSRIMVDLAVCDRKEKGCKFQVFSFSRYLGVIMWSEWTNNGSRSSNGLSTRDIYGKATLVLQSLNDAVERCGLHRNNGAAHTMGVAGPLWLSGPVRRRAEPTGRAGG